MIEQLKKIGTVKTKKSIDIKKSKISLGFEKLDRDLFDPEKAYDAMAETGVKWARLQSGWQRTEREKGVYNFKWLDDVVDKLLSIGIQPWLCLCYGNDLYTPSAKTVFGAVGCPPIQTEEERNAWANYVTATVSHFKGRISRYEIWNEPDGKWCWKHGPNPKELLILTEITAKACKAADPDCEVIGMATCHAYGDFLDEFWETGFYNYVDAISYHAYGALDITFSFYNDNYKENVKKYKPTLKIIQGETGAQSKSCGCGALEGGAWNELNQAKTLLRHIIMDLSFGVEMTSYFSCLDMAEALKGTVGDIQTIKDFGYFGILGADFDDEAKATGNYYKKPSYYALCNISSILCEDYESCELETIAVEDYSQRMLSKNFDFNQAKKCYFERGNGSGALFYWKSVNPLVETYNGETSFKIKMKNSLNVKLIDLLDGSIYELDSNHFTIEDGYYKFTNVPITDSPLLITFGDF